MKRNTKNYSLTYPKIIAIGFACIIVIGTILLYLPISTRGDAHVPFIDALFTATSATCVAGLVPFDTYTSWSLFGQVVILCLIQIGGLGFITIIGFVFRLIRHRASIKEKMLLKESLGALEIVNVKGLVRTVLVSTATLELVGACILATRFIPMTESWGKGIFMALFTSISAYCNAGFELMGFFEKSSSLVTVNNDPIILLTISLLIIAGSIGFTVWNDLSTTKYKFAKLTAHSRLVLVTTGILLVGGTMMFLFFENDKAFADMSIWQKVLNAFFCSTTRSAGFNSIPLCNISNPSKMLTILLMFIGGSSGSTAGGVKTTTIAILFLCVISTMRNNEDINVFNKRIPLVFVKKAVTIVFFNLAIILFSTFIIAFLQPEFKLTDVLFECTAAASTAGMGIGITSQLHLIPKLLVIGMMYIGRLTSFIFVMMFVTTKAKTTSQKPKGTIIIG